MTFCSGCARYSIESPTDPMCSVCQREPGDAWQAAMDDEAMTYPSVSEALHLLGHIEADLEQAPAISRQYIRFLRLLIKRAVITPRALPYVEEDPLLLL